MSQVFRENLKNRQNREISCRATAMNPLCQQCDQSMQFLKAKITLETP